MASGEGIQGFVLTGVTPLNRKELGAWSLWKSLRRQVLPNTLRC